MRDAVNRLDSTMTQKVGKKYHFMTNSRER